MGAGGSTIALTWHLMQPSRGADRPSRIVVSNRSPDRLDHIRRIHEALESGIPTDYVLAGRPEDNDAVMHGLEPGSLVVNATASARTRRARP
jgi:shikimate 5-dehydrogenase